MFSILVVEDDAALNKMMTARLKQEAYTVFSAFDGEEALDIMDVEHVDLIVCDKAAGVDELVALAENFNKMAAELEGMDYMRRDFMSNVSHELKTPIAAIAGFTELLQSPNLTDAERAEYAVKYTPDGRAIHVTAEGLDACRMVRENSASNTGGRTTSVFRVCIRDEGEGISPEKLPKVFDQFYQCEESHKQLGHGLGLAITKRIMELLGGSVEVTSTVGEGSTFTVTL